VAFLRKLHQHPELSGKEVVATTLIADELQTLGLEVMVWPGETGVVALLKGAHSGKTLALRADIDALPVKEISGLPFASVSQGIAHACGHDIHTAVLLGTARVLSSLKDRIQGNVKFIFQGAEEQLTGARQMIERGVLEKPNVDHILALHCWPEIPAGTIGVKTGSFMASSDSLAVTVEGAAGHAAHPHKCIDAVVGAAAVVGAVQTIVSRETSPVDATVVTFGSIHGGTAANIIAPLVELQGTVRTVSQQVREAMPVMLTRCVEHTAAAYRCKGTVTYTQGTPPVVNHPDLVAGVERAAVRMLGDKQVVHLENISMGSEDFAFYMEKVPGAIFRLGTANAEAQSRLPLHNPAVIFDEKALTTGVMVLSAAAIDYLTDGK
jgi:amidohydrolase/hippurate hydrolase